MAISPSTWVGNSQMNESNESARWSNVYLSKFEEFWVKAKGGYGYIDIMDLTSGQL